MGFFHNKWFIIGIIILILLITIAVADRMNLIPYVNEMRDLKNQNEYLKKKAEEREAGFTSALKEKEVQIEVIDQKIVDLQKRNTQLVRVNLELEKKTSELERKYDELKKKVANIEVPADRLARAAKFRELGY